MPVSQYELDRIARVKARAEKKKKPTTKKTPKKGLTQREKDLAEIKRYNVKYREGAKKDTRPLASLGGYGKTDSTAASGGSKAVRKVTADDNDLVNRIRKNRPKYFK